MKKKKLKTFKVLNATDKMKNVVEQDKGYLIQRYDQSDTWEPNYHWFIRVASRNLDGQAVMQIFLYTREDMLEGRRGPKYMIYLSKKEQSFLTYEPAIDKWRTATIDHLDYGKHILYGATIKHWIEEKDEIKICTYINNQYKTAYTSIRFFQCNTRRQKEIDYIDHYMNQVPELPKRFERWLNDYAMIKSKYILYHYAKKVTEGFCTHCGQTVPVEAPKYNQTGICPNCKSKVTYKSIKKAGHIVDWGAGSIIQKTKEGYVVRYFDIKKDYEDYQRPKLLYWEGIRTVYDEDFRREQTFEYTKFHGTQIIRWCKKDYNSWKEKVMEKRSIVYDRNLKQIFKGSRMQYSAWELFIRQNRDYEFFPSYYMEAYLEHPSLEYLVKMGLNKLARALIDRRTIEYLDLKAKNLKTMLRLPKDERNKICKMDVTSREYVVTVEANEMGTVLTQEQIRFFAEISRHHNFQRYVRYTTPYKMIKYIKEQMKDEDFDVGDYHDYLKMAAQLEYDLRNEFVIFPRHFKQAHDDATEESNLRKEELEQKKEHNDNQIIKKQREQLGALYEIETEDLLIRMPESATEIRHEGQQLHHCVGTYVKRVVEGKTTILFIRKKAEPKKSYYTMEVRENEIIQVRGLNNKAPLDDVKRLVEKFKKERLEKNKAKERKAS
ncbi:PcfJ domain-containing protein [Anaerosacchariphilus polymeriproducens]|uniref:PcfJ-like protein n=1 Tax=Anaerosacchariphilus polymeriproducens TaxID=1812858 RepID=A0A371ARI9_9FIRM|nr:PcfJ domain-containing protein [Anaerosacchariphilus polymeriproducens]RDU22188.1 hypothetical protein DWV06_16815 [Anaerosacchariphilus polymeriproducens]